MEKLFAITLLTLISVLEIVIMLIGTMLPVAAVMIALVLLLVFLMVFRLGSRHFWKMISFTFMLNLMLFCYLFLKLGPGVFLMLIFCMIIAGLLFSALFSQKRRLRMAESIRPSAFHKAGMQPAPRVIRDSKQDSHAASIIESCIQDFEEKDFTENTVAENADEPGKDKHEAPQELHGIPEPPLPPYGEPEMPIAKPRTTVRKRFSPGKFLASRNGRQYHRPRCNWANNIREENRIWFATAQEAEKKGYSRHSCLKKA